MGMPMGQPAPDPQMLAILLQQLMDQNGGMNGSAMPQGQLGGIPPEMMEGGQGGDMDSALLMALLGGGMPGMSGMPQQGPPQQQRRY